MAFTLRVIFTGLCAFVENDNQTDPTKMMVVLVNGTRPETEGTVLALDDTPLRYHRPFVTFPIADVQPPVPEVNGLPVVHGLWYLNRERLSFEITEDGSVNNTFDVQRPFLGNPHPEVHDDTAGQLRSFTWIADLSQVAPDHTDVADGVVASAGVSPRAIGQVLIPKGRLRPFSFSRAIWEFDRFLSGQAHRRNFAHEVALTLGGLTAAQLVSQPLDTGSTTRTVNLVPPTGSDTVTVRISNLCEINPLQWFTVRGPEPDEDTKWFYEILSDATRNALRTDLGGRRLPIPRPVQFLHGAGGPGSSNCIPLQTARKWFTT
jgi:hypothetical protein